MAKNQLNNLSKRQILESLMYEQNQSNATLSRLVTAVARTAGLDPEKLAEHFIDDKGNQEFIDKFNLSVKSHHASVHKDGDHAGHEGHDHAAPIEPTAPDSEPETKPE